jgi:hypothetical protein
MYFSICSFAFWSRETPSQHFVIEHACLHPINQSGQMSAFLSNVVSGTNETLSQCHERANTYKAGLTDGVNIVLYHLMSRNEPSSLL